MNSSLDTVVTAIATVLVVSAICSLLAFGCSTYTTGYIERAKACAQSGGTFLAQTQDCVVQHSTAR